MKILRAILVAIFLCVSLQTVYAETEDIGEIAIIEDVDGTILSGMAAMMPDAFLRGVSCAFYMTHPDEYDAIIVFNTSVTNVQQGWVTKNETEGIGRILWNWNAGHCASQDRLRAAINMGNINTLPYNPDDIAAIVPFFPLTGIELLGHEFGHQWLASVNFDKNDGNGTQCLLRGYEPTGTSTVGEKTCSGGNMNDFNQHWSYNFNSCSLMYGSCISEKEEGRFIYTYNNVKYSQLDQYLMGIRSKDEVDPMFVVDTGDLGGTASIPLQHGNSAEHTGTRIDVTIDDIIRENGPRIPEKDICHWKSAFILVHPAGQPPTQAQIQQVESYRVRWEEFYQYATDNRGSFDTTLHGCGTGTAGCPGEKSYMCDSKICTEEELRCKSISEVILCKDSEWVTVATCPEGTSCDGGTCKKNAVDGDYDLDSGETEADIEIANEQDTTITSGCVDDTDCPAGYNCINTECIIENNENADGDVDGVYCEPNKIRCLGEIHQVCNFNGTSWTDVENCRLSGKICDDAEGCVDNSGCSVIYKADKHLYLILFMFVLLFSIRLWSKKRLSEP